MEGAGSEVIGGCASETDQKSNHELQSASGRNHVMKGREKGDTQQDKSSGIKHSL